ncbi:SusD/RagB family nutrient-binding outer membrane lipoprotein [Sphingobacterium sp. UT-1RO-CII-1]|uniref:SusD/RagB family nutrient-binding outer membrane lipoprotein n=1 Tax=Sphingobacterium sp. UT-1RO-CII-1 TaxID=2995225 RepID=UPI00227C53E9|nr:SusD/RagB family nutrient-binding outer membrane lipoprotein [Sphingobacterium sp. UT-1RO-CII-1]MCY4779812.1 SusD/RagB family nutrient-binding outer membrane lipoprotein [Sphingobacterium sp. UT-1RO-CII-1]
MRDFKYIIGLLFVALQLAGCSDSIFEDINTDPNRPSAVSTSSLLVSGEKLLMNTVRNPDLNLRGAQLYAQYFSQNIYTDQSRYMMPTGYSDAFWTGLNRALNNFNEIIKLNVDEKTKNWATLGAAGSNANQIAVVRILKSYAFHNLSDVFGDIPYQSYGNNDPDFEALQQDPDNLTPKYATQEKIYVDILNELKQSADTLLKYQEQQTFKNADIIYDGNNLKWAKFANSLRLRLANRIAHKLPSLATEHIEDALAKGVFASNADNAIFKYSSSSPNEAPLYQATITANRKDFAISHVLVDVLKGDRGPFNIADPRLEIFAKPNSKGVYFGQPYGLPLAAGDLFPVDSISLPGAVINAANYGEVLMEYAEVEFLISEINDWEDKAYKKAVRASLDKWQVSTAAADLYVQQLPSANKENVLSQKYLALFNQGIESWSEIRRTGYPLFLIKKGDVVWSGTVEGEKVSYQFTPEVGSEIPSRFIYPLKEQSTNKLNYQQALSKQGDDVIGTKVWWNKAN